MFCLLPGDGTLGRLAAACRWLAFVTGRVSAGCRGSWSLELWVWPLFPWQLFLELLLSGIKISETKSEVSEDKGRKKHQFQGTAVTLWLSWGFSAAPRGQFSAAVALEWCLYKKPWSAALLFSIFLILLIFFKLRSLYTKLLLLKPVSHI